MTPTNPAIQLTEEPEVVNWPATHYVFIEKTGAIHANRAPSVAGAPQDHSCH